MNWKVGQLVDFDGGEIRVGFLPCDGSEFSGDIYPDLAEYLGETKTPDMRNPLDIARLAQNGEDLNRATVFAIVARPEMIE